MSADDDLEKLLAANQASVDALLKERAAADAEWITLTAATKADLSSWKADMEKATCRLEAKDDSEERHAATVAKADAKMSLAFARAERAMRRLAGEAKKTPHEMDNVRHSIVLLQLSKDSGTTCRKLAHLCGCSERTIRRPKWWKELRAAMSKVAKEQRQKVAKLEYRRFLQKQRGLNGPE